MPTVQGTDDFAHGNFTVPGGASYSAIVGTPVSTTAVLHSPDPASLLIQSTAAAENVEHAITGSPTLPWHGFWFYQASADEPATDFHVSQVNCADGIGGRIDFQVSSNKFFSYVNGGAAFPLSAAYTFGTWVWIESIVDCSTGTRTHYCRINGVDQTPATRAIAASTGAKSSLGPTSADDTKMYYSNHKWGFASSTSDWLGPPSSATAPSAPQTLNADAGNNQVSLTWAAPLSDGGSAVTAYKIYRSISSNTETLLASPAGTGVTYTDSTATNGTTYYYKVSALNAIGESALSNEDSAVPAAPVPPVQTETRVLKRLYGPAQLDTPSVTLYTCPTLTRATIRHIHVSNATAGSVDFTLSVGTSTAATRLWDGFPIAAHDMLDHYQEFTLSAGEVIQGSAGATASLNLTIDGYEVQATSPIYPSDTLLPSNTSP